MTMTISRQQTEITTAGVIRRVQALVARGWPYHEVDSWLDARPGTARRIAEFGFPRLSTADMEDIARVYSYVEDRDPAGRPLEESRLAGPRRWAAPEHWTGADIDNPRIFPSERASDIDMMIAHEALASGYPEMAAAMVTSWEDRAELAWRMDIAGIPHTAIGRICGRGSAAENAASLLEYRRGREGRAARSVADKSRVRIVTTGNPGFTLTDYGTEVWGVLVDVAGPHRAVESLTGTDERGLSVVAGVIAENVLGWPTRTIKVDWSTPCDDRCPRDQYGHSRHRFSGRCAMANDYALRSEMDALFTARRADRDVCPAVVCLHLHKSTARVSRMSKYGRDLGFDVTVKTVAGVPRDEKTGAPTCG